MALTDRLQRVAGRVAVQSARMALRLRRYSTGKAPVMPGVGLPATPYPVANERSEAQLQSTEALTSRVAVRAGPLPTRITSYQGDLNPTMIDTVFRSADQGIAIYHYADFTKKMREVDAHLMGIDRQRRQGVANKEFMVWPQLDTDPVCVGMAHFMRAAMNGIDGLPSSVYSALSKNCDGWSLNELVWTPGKVRFQLPDGNGGGPLVTLRGMLPRSIEWVHAKHTTFKQDTFEPMLDLGTGGPVHLPRHKFLYSLAAGEGLASARGYSRSVAWLHFFKHASLRDWNVFLHIYGIPLLQGKIKRQFWKDAAMREVLELALQAFGTGEEAPILPLDDMSIEVTQPVSVSGSDAWHKMAGFCNAEQSKAVLGETLTTEAGESGSYKLGDVHKDSAHDVIVGDALTTASDIRADLFTSVIELNADALAQIFNTRPEELASAIPLCGFMTDQEWSPKDRLEMFAKAAEIGVHGSQSQVRRELRIDKPASDQDRVTGKPVTITAGGATVGSADAAQGVKNPKPEDAGESKQPTPDDSPTSARTLPPAQHAPQEPPATGGE